MQTGEARNSFKAGGIQDMSVPPGFVSPTAFILKRIPSTEDTQKHALLKNGSDLTPHEFSILEANLLIKHRAWIIHDLLDHHEKELDDEPHQENVASASEDWLPKGLIWGCSACSSCLKVPAQWDPEDPRSIKLEEAPVFQPTDEEFEDSLKYIESISQQAKPYGICRIVPPPSWQPPPFFRENNACEGINLTTQLQKINDFRDCSKRKSLASSNVQQLKRRRISKLAFDNSGNIDTIDFEELRSPQAEQLQSQCGPHLTFESFKKNADFFKKCYFQKKSKVGNSDIGQWEPSEEDIEGEYWRILEKPTAEIEVLCRANLDPESLQRRVLQSLQTETSNSDGYQDSGWNLSNLNRLPGSLLSLENSDCLRDLAPQFQIGMCFSTLPWELATHHLYSLWCLHLGAPKIWYGVPGQYFIKFQEVVKKHFPGISVQSPEMLHKLALQVSPSTLQSEGIPVYRCIQNPKEFVLFLPGAYHTGIDCGFNISESVCFATLEWLPHGQGAVELYREKHIKQVICHDKLLMKAAQEAVKARWDYLMKSKKAPPIIRWKDACGDGKVIAETLKARVKAEARQRKFLCTDTQSRKMSKCFDEGARKECCICNTILYLSAAFCQCNPKKYSCLKHTKNLCRCVWSEKVFLLRLDINELNLFVQAAEGKFSVINTWVKKNLGYELDYCGSDSIIDVIPEDESFRDIKLESKGHETSFPSDIKEVVESETVTRILRILNIPFDTDDKIPFGLKGKKPLAESHSASNGQATESSKQETRSAVNPDVIICISSDDED